MKTVKDFNYHFEHTKKRLKERYNLDINYDEFNSLSVVLAINKESLIIVENRSQEIHQINFKGKNVIFVYNNVAGCITTSLENWRK